jgi:hypothetical protein
MRGITRVEMRRERHVLVLDRQGFGMRIGDQHAPLAAALSFSRNSSAPGRIAPRGAPRASAARCRVQLARPVIDAIPIDGAAAARNFGSSAPRPLRASRPRGAAIMIGDVFRQNQLSKRRSSSVPSMSSSTVSIPDQSTAVGTLILCMIASDEGPACPERSPDADRRSRRQPPSCGSMTANSRCSARATIRR